MTNPRAPATSAIVLAGLLSLAAAMGIGRFAFTPLLPLMAREGQLDLAFGGWLAAANYAGYFAGALSAARLPLGARRLAVLALGATALLTAAMAWPAPPLWLLLRFAAGAVSAWVFVATSVWCLGELARREAGAQGGWVYAGRRHRDRLDRRILPGGRCRWGRHGAAVAAPRRGRPAADAAGGVGARAATAAACCGRPSRSLGAGSARRHARPHRLLWTDGIRLHPAGHLPAGAGPHGDRRPALVRAGLAGVRPHGGRFHRVGRSARTPRQPAAGLGLPARC
jgi:hypothetical protein